MKTSSYSSRHLIWKFIFHHLTSYLLMHLRIMCCFRVKVPVFLSMSKQMNKELGLTRNFYGSSPLSPLPSNLTQFRVITETETDSCLSRKLSSLIASQPGWKVEIYKSVCSSVSLINVIFIYISCLQLFSRNKLELSWAKLLWSQSNNNYNQKQQNNKN